MPHAPGRRQPQHGSSRAGANAGTLPTPAIERRADRRDLPEAGVERSAATSSGWRVQRPARAGDHIHIVFGVGGERDIGEHEFDHLAGYQYSRPVRVQRRVEADAARPLPTSASVAYSTEMLEPSASAGLTPRPNAPVANDAHEI
jgi:hypothetical protein